MRVEKVSADSVRARLAAHKNKNEQSQKGFNLDEHLKRRAEEEERERLEKQELRKQKKQKKQVENPDAEEGGDESLEMAKLMGIQSFGSTKKD